MPLYEYQCTVCGETEEAIQKFSDPPLTTCRQCAGKLNKLISQSSFHLKGTGWYVTDYSKKSDASEEKTASETPASKSEKSSTKDATSTSAKGDE
jgi:putative FmdB family regulatory protein